MNLKPELKFRIVAAIFLSVLTVVFWMGSRVPQLNVKAAMGEMSEISGIAFEPVLPVLPEDPYWKKVTYNMVNWMDTNKKGMAFGILFAAAFLVLLSSLKNLSFKSRFLNSLMGALAGAPLGVCVNCAAPIGFGVRAGGARIESAVSMMISSPTLNFIVLSMLLAFFPIYVVFLKILFTLILLLLIVPLVSKYFGKEFDKERMADQTGKLSAQFNLPFLSIMELAPQANWVGVLKHWGSVFLKSLWFIIRKTVPLMILAGLLGSAVVTFLPLEGIVEWLGPEPGRVLKYSVLLLILVLGTILPVPIAFDIIVATVLMAAGVPMIFVMGVLFCLGTYSIYAHFIIHKMSNTKIANALFVAVVLLGGVAAYSADKASKTYNNKEQEYIYNHLAIFPFEGPEKFAEYEPRSHSQYSGIEIDSILATFKIRQWEVYDNPGFSINKESFKERIGSSEPNFSRYMAPEFGINEVLTFHEDDMTFFKVYGSSVATADVHGDGWTDILLTLDNGLALYANVGGQQFFKQQVNRQKKVAPIINAAFADMDNDGWLDIVCSSFGEGNYIIYNDGNGHFDAGIVEDLPGGEYKNLTMAMSFGDFNRDGRLEMAAGNWTTGLHTFNRQEKSGVSLASSGNVLFYFENGSWNQKDLPGLPGETLAILMSDFTGNTGLDLIVGNDFVMPDQFYKGNNTLDLHRIIPDDSLIEISPSVTMSVATADINNDLIPEIFLTQASWSSTENVVTDAAQSTSHIKDPALANYANRILEFDEFNNDMMNSIQTFIMQPYFPDYIMGLLNENTVRQETRNAYFLLYSGTTTNSNKLEDVFTSNDWSTFSFLKSASVKGQVHTMKSVTPQNITQKNMNHVLLEQNDKGIYIDKAAAYGLDKSGWSWTGKFADIDLDGWQDVFVVNGFFEVQSFKGVNMIERSALFMNEKGKRFSDQTEAWNLTDSWPVLEYSWIDIDNDGDLDLITMPTYLLPNIYINNSTSGNAIVFALEDNSGTGNAFGIGGKVTVYYGGKANLHQIREIQSGGGFKSFDAPLAHFGLGGVVSVDSVKVQWPDGKEISFNQSFEAGAKYTVVKK